MTNQLERSGFKLSTLLQDNQDGVFTKWRVENSWGEDHGHKGNTNSGCLGSALRSVSGDMGRKQP